MWPSVRSAFVPFSAPLEGVVPWMYVDQAGLVTTGMGNLIDPVDLAVALPWKHARGVPATEFDKRAAWSTVKFSKREGTGGGNQGDLTDLRLDAPAIDALVATKLAQLEILARHHFPGWETLYADVQLGILSMLWAMGDRFDDFPKFTAAVNDAAWKTAAFQSWMRDSKDWVPSSLDDDPSAHPPNLNAGLRPRNLANRALFLNATLGGDPSILHWTPPGAPSSPASPPAAPSPPTSGPVAGGGGASGKPVVKQAGFGIVALLGLAYAAFRLLEARACR